jgi:hypothetical protein
MRVFRRPAIIFRRLVDTGLLTPVVKARRVEFTLIIASPEVSPVSLVGAIVTGLIAPSASSSVSRLLVVILLASTVVFPEVGLR